MSDEIFGHQAAHYNCWRMTGVTVEDAFWKGLKEIAKRRHETLSHLVANIDADRQHANLSSAIRLYVLAFYRDQYRG
jgi:predicted DNA-binding ribbon-helix-helix protein